MSVWKKIGKTLLFVLECVGYLIMVISFMWILLDLLDGKKK